MQTFTAIIKQFAEQGEKTGWSYVEIPLDIVRLLKPGNKKSFRVKGKIDNHHIEKQSVLPLGGGVFIIPLNATLRKAIRKNKGAMVKLQLAEDPSPLEICSELLDCLQDEPKALKNFRKLTPSHQRYFSNWILSAKTEATQAKRIAKSVDAMLKGLKFNEMLKTKD